MASDHGNSSPRRNGRRNGKDVPQFAPNFTVYALPPDTVCLYSEDRKFLLHGELYYALACAIGEGGKSFQELVGELEQDFPADEIHEALKRLVERRYVLPTSRASNGAIAAYWASLRLPPEIAMDHAVAADADYRLDAALHGRHRFGLPLVSVIVVNYNYGRFLIEAVESIIAQTYPNIELIIADDASTDDSASILDGIEVSCPDAKIIRRTVNGGQSLASRQGFEACSGEYVVFLDADDVLLPDFVATHVFVHLSIRIPVGFSSSDMAQASGSRIVTGMLHFFSDYIRSGKGKCENLIRRVDENSPELWPLPDLDEDICKRIHLVEPTYQGAWVWAPTSGNLFRRDALSMFFDNDALANLRSCTDAYLVRGVAVLNGSVLIDRTLSIYRLHGANAFSRFPHLNGVVSYDRGSPSDNDQRGRRLAIDHIIAKADVFCCRLHSSSHYLNALKALNDSWPRMPSNIAGCRSYVEGEVITHFQEMARAIGLWPLTRWAIWLGITPPMIVRILFRLAVSRAMIRGKRGV